MKNLDENRVVNCAMWLILIVCLTCVVAIFGVLIGFLAFFVTSYLGASNFVSWVMVFVFGVPTGIVFGWFYYKDMTKKRGE